MPMPVRTLGLIIALIVLIAGIVLLITQFGQHRPEILGAPAVPLAEPVIKEVSAELGWQNTQILLESGETIHVQFLSGEVRDGETVLRGPAGSGYVCGDSTCCEPIPEAPRAALIGRVGDHLFLVGDKNTMEVQETGELQLRINDCDEGLFDNSGSLTIRISP